MSAIKITKESLLAIAIGLIGYGASTKDLYTQILFVIAGLIVIGIRTWTKELR